MARLWFFEPGFLYIETPRSRTDEESMPDRQVGDSVKDFFSVLFANPVAKPTGNALTGIQLFCNILFRRELRCN